MALFSVKSFEIHSVRSNTVHDGVRSNTVHDSIRSNTVVLRGFNYA